MKTFDKLFLVTLIHLAQATSAAEITWWSFTGGGGISRDCVIAVGGALGPIAPALSPATGGAYTLSGGFWPALSGQPITARPLLKITRLGLGEGSKVMLSWPVGVSGFALEYTPELGSGNWTVGKEEVVDSATEHTVTVPATEAARC